MTYLPITDHGLIGDLHTTALVKCDGRIVWLPWPRFHSPALFTALLDDQHGDDWLLAPLNVTMRRQRYDGATAILLTEFETDQGHATLYDWMSPWEGTAAGHDLCCVLRCTEGMITVHGRFAPRPDYARANMTLHLHDDGLDFQTQQLDFHLASNYDWTTTSDQDMATLQITLRQGEEVRCVLSSGQRMAVDDIEADQDRTHCFWQDWIERCSYHGRWADMVRRAAITLKLLTYAPTGAIVAAPTTSLPEWIGGIRNWDYRYTWLRDASLTLYALYLLDFRKEACAFFEWICKLAQHHPVPLQIMYGINGEACLTETELDHLEGYRGSRPVRIGNHAYEQSQLDVYGSMIDAAYLYENQGELLSREQWQTIRKEINYVCAHWSEPDQGIWEIRGPAV